MNEQRHWLYRPATIARLCAWGVGALLVTVIAELFVTLYEHFAFTGWFGFHAVFGFVSCVLMVVVARGFARVVKRRADYYEDGSVSGPMSGQVASSGLGASTPGGDAARGNGEGST